MKKGLSVKLAFVVLLSSLSSFAQTVNPVHWGDAIDGQNPGGTGASLAAPQSVFISGNYAYVASYTSNALEIVDVSNPASPVHKGSLLNGTGGALLKNPNSVYVAGNYAYVTSASNALEIIDVSNPALPAHKGSLTHGTGGALLDLPSSVYVSGNYAYIASYNSNALEIVDVSNPAIPVHKGKVTSLTTLNSVFVSGNYAYVTSYNGNALWIVDVSNPAAPTYKAGLSNGTGGALLSNPNSVYVVGNYAFVSSKGSGALEIVDISNPAAPAHKGSLTNGTGGPPYSVYVSGSYAYIATYYGYSSGVLEVVDVSNPAAPLQIGSLMDGTGGAMLGSARSVFVSGNYAYVASFGSNALEVVDVSNPASPTHRASLINGTGGALLNAPQAVYVSGNYAYVASYYSNALEILDVSNPAAPVHKGSLINGTGGALMNNPYAVYVSGNYAYLTSASNALEIVDVSDPTAPVHKGSLTNGTGGALLGGPWSVFVSGSYAYVASISSNALEIVDVSNPALPVHKGSLTNGTGGALLFNPNSVFVSGNYAYIASHGSNALEIVDVSNPAAPTHKGSLTDGTGGALLGYTESVFVYGNNAYVLSGYSNALEIVDVSNPSAPVHKGSLTDGTGGALLNNPASVYVSGAYAYVASYFSNAIEIIDISNPATPTHKASLTSGIGGALLSGANSIFVSGNKAYVTSSGSSALEIVSIFIPASPVAAAAGATTQTSFQANWGSVLYAAGYYLDVSTDNFSTFVSGYNNLSVGNVTSLSITGLSGSTSYQYRIRANNVSGTSPSSNVISVTTAPVNPTALAASSLTQSSFTSNWNASATATGYYLDVSTSSTFSSYVTGYNGLDVHNVTSYGVNGLSSGQTYYYRVRAYSASGTSGNSNSTTVATIPPNPVALAATSLMQTSFTSNWSLSNSATGYYLDVSTSNTFSSFVSGYNAKDVGNVTTFGVTGLSPGTSYYYRVRAYNGSGQSGNSSLTSTTTIAPDPVASAGTSLAQTSFNANWAASTSATGYYLDVSTSSSFSSFVAGYNGIDIGATSYSVSGLSPGTTYYYRVRAHSLSGISGNSNLITVLTTPANPVTVAATATTQTSFTANWAASPSATGYLLNVSTSSTFATLLPGYSGLDVGNTTNYNVGGLTEGATYYYAVSAYSASGASGGSNVTTVVTVPPNPVASPPNLFTQTSLSANWIATTSATGYYLDVSTSNTFSSLLPGYDGLDVSNVNSYAVIGLSAGVTYYYRVRAYNASGASGYSNSVSGLMVPEVPNALPASAISQTNFVASWSAATGATGYHLDVSTYSDFRSVTVIDIASTSSIVNGLVAGTTYYYRVRASNASGASENSNVVSLTTVLSGGGASQASGVQFSGVSGSALTCSFTTGSGTGRLVVASTSPLASVPQNGTTYIGNASYGNGQTVGGGYVVANGPVTTVTITNLNPGSVYYVQVFEYLGVPGSESYVTGNAAGNPNFVTTIPPSPVISPGNNTASTEASITLMWNASNGATDYYLDVSTDANDFTHPILANQHVSGATSFVLASLNPGTTYYYRVRAQNSSGLSGNSAVFSVMTAPPSPSHVSVPVTSVSQHSFDVTWDVSTSATTYHVVVSTSSDYSNPIVNTEVTTGNIYHVTTGTSGTIYYCEVKATNASGSSGYSVSGPIITRPADPTAVVPSAAPTESSFAATWNASQGAAKYYLYVSVASDFSNPIIDKKDVGNVQTYTVSGLTAGTTYFYRVRAYNDSGESGDSNVIPVTTNLPSAITQSISGLTSGGTLANYSMFSIPLIMSDSSIQAIFSSLGLEGRNRWRLLHWNGNSYTEFGTDNELTTIDRGKSYWFNSFTPPSIVVTGIPYYKSSYKMKLVQGWNQVGSPYNFDVSWADVLMQNASQTGVSLVESSLYKYVPASAGFIATDNLKAWGGAFVFNGGSTVTLTIPGIVKHATGGRIASPRTNDQQSNGGWMTPLRLTVGEITNDMAGLGMHPEASSSYDRYDAITLPPFLKYAELNSYHEEFFAHRFSKDIVPMAESYNWKYTVESNAEDRFARLEWDREIFGNNEAQLLLFDQEAEKLIDMRLTDHYTFEMDGKRMLRFFYASRKENLRPDVTQVLAPYPNPVTSIVTIPYIASEDTDPKITLYDNTGKTVRVLLQESTDRGVQQVGWDCTDSQGVRVPPGIYLYRFTSASAPPQTGKLIVQ